MRHEDLSAFVENAQIGKDPRQLDAELYDVVIETAKRKANGLDVEDQEARAANLREARALLN